MTRREVLQTAIAPAVMALTPVFADAPGQKALLGGSPTTFNVRARIAKQNNQRLDLLDWCHQLGLAGTESILLSPDPETSKATRKKVEAYNMVLILNAPLPKTESDVANFDKAVAACKESGASALHAAMTGRRYEDFDSLAAFQSKFSECKKSIGLAEPVLRKYRMPLAIENHKGWRAIEQAAWMNEVSSEWVGVCLDMGNNLSLCEPPDETFDALTPYTIFSHIKDMGLQDYPDGFLLSEVPFGEGVINLKERVAQLRRKDPKMLFCLEMITRDPLKVPVFTDKYWTTFSDRATQIPAQDLAKVLEIVRNNPPKTPLPRVENLNPEEALAEEDKNNLACIRHARQFLNM